MKLTEIKTGKSVADLEIEYTGGGFYCNHRGLTSLQGSPPKIEDNFDCTFNKLTSLEGAPQEVGKGFFCNNNELTSLKGAPQKVGGGFYCYNNSLASLEGAPKEVPGSFLCYNNNLTSLEGAPQEVGAFNCSNNIITSLKNIHKIVKKIGGNFGGNFKAIGCPIQSHVLGLLLIKNLKEVKLDNKEVAAIINAHLDGGSMRSAMDCQHALIKAGFLEFAKL